MGMAFTHFLLHALNTPRRGWGAKRTEMYMRKKKVKYFVKNLIKSPCTFHFQELDDCGITQKRKQ